MGTLSIYVARNIKREVTGTGRENASNCSVGRPRPNSGGRQTVARVALGRAAIADR